MYQPTDRPAIALADEVSESLSSGKTPPSYGNGSLLSSDQNDLKALPWDNFVTNVIKPALRQFSMNAYERVYSMEARNVQASRRSVLEDTMNLASVVD